MDFEEKVRAVTNVFEKLDKEMSAFQARTTLHCTHGCGKCCFKPDIEATVLEFLPFALHLYKDGIAEAWQKQLGITDSSICLILNSLQTGVGLCTQYQHRGLICRLFGYSARINKYGKKQLVTCSIIKTEQAGPFKNAEKEINEGKEVPVMSDYYMQLYAIDQELTKIFYPINTAIRKAIEEVLHYYAYR